MRADPAPCRALDRQTWLDGLDDRWYYPFVLTINLLLAAWFIAEARAVRATSSTV